MERDRESSGATKLGQNELISTLALPAYHFYTQNPPLIKHDHENEKLGPTGRP